jgi:H+/Cl- antiporter ClcA
VNDPAGEPSPPAALENLLRELREAHRELVVLLSARIDLYLARLRRAVLLGAAAGLAAVLGLIVLIVALVLLLDGLSRGLGEWLGGREWLGRIIVAAITLGGAAVAGLFTYRKLTRVRPRTLEKYREE